MRRKCRTPRTVRRSSVTSKFVTKRYAGAHKKTTEALDADIRLRYRIFIVAPALAEYAGVSHAQVTPGRHPVPPGQPSGAHPPHGGHEVGESGGDAACLFVLLLFSLVIGLGFVCARTLGWLRAYRTKRKRAARMRAEEHREKMRQERKQASAQLWSSFEARIQMLVAAHYPIHTGAEIDRITRELQYCHWELSSTLLLISADQSRMKLVTVSVNCPRDPKRGEIIELMYAGKLIVRLEIPDVAATLWHIRRRSGQLDGPITAARLREIVQDLTPSPGKRIPKGMRIDSIRNNRDSKWRFWSDAEAEYPDLVLAGVLQGREVDAYDVANLHQR